MIIIIITIVVEVVVVEAIVVEIVVIEVVVAEVASSSHPSVLTGHGTHKIYHVCAWGV